MRRIYESDALKRDDEESFTPHERSRETKPQMFRSLNAAAWSDRFLPHSLRCRAVSVRLRLPREEFESGQPIPFIIKMKNSLPLPVSIRTTTPVLWSWSVDGFDEASKVTVNNPPAEPAKIRFDRGERIQFEKQWSQMFRVSDREWVPAEPGEYTLRAEINVDSNKAYSLFDEKTIRILP